MLYQPLTGCQLNMRKLQARQGDCRSRAASTVTSLLHILVRGGCDPEAPKGAGGAAASLTESLHIGTVMQCAASWQLVVKSWEEKERGGGEEEEEGRQSTGISFPGNHHLAHGNKLPALLKQREMGVVAVAVALKLKGEGAAPYRHLNSHFTLQSVICSILHFVSFFHSFFLLFLFLSLGVGDFSPRSLTALCCLLQAHSVSSTQPPSSTQSLQTTAVCVCVFLFPFQHSGENGKARSLRLWFVLVFLLHAVHGNR